jgi:hypothetical protein
MKKGFLLTLIKLITICLFTLQAQTPPRSAFLPEEQRTIKIPIPIIDKSTQKEKLSSELNTLYEKYMNQEAFTAFAGQSGLTVGD